MRGRRGLGSRRWVRLTDRNSHTRLLNCRGMNSSVLSPRRSPLLPSWSCLRASTFACLRTFLGVSPINLFMLCSSVRSSCQVYRFSSETKTFLRNCGDLLNMSSHSDTAIMRRLETVLEGRTDVESDARLRVSHDTGSWKSSR